MRLAKFPKSPGDRKRYSIDYSQWLDAGEVLSNVVTSTDDPDGVYVDGILIDPTGQDTVIMYVSGGSRGRSYDVSITVTTTGDQVREDYVTFVVMDTPDFM